MEIFLGPKYDLLRVILGGQKSRCSKIDNGRIAPRRKAYDFGNAPTSKYVNLSKPLVVIYGGQNP